MSFSAFLTGTLLVSSAALTGLLAMPAKERTRLPGRAWLGGLAVLGLGFAGGWFIAD